MEKRCQGLHVIAMSLPRHALSGSSRLPNVCHDCLVDACLWSIGEMWYQLIFALRYDSMLNAMLLLGARTAIIVNNNVSDDA